MTMETTHKVAWHGSFSSGQGYSGSSEQTALAIDKRDDTDLCLVPFDVQKQIPKGNVSDEGHDLLSKPFNGAHVHVAHGLPCDFWTIQPDQTHDKDGFRVGFTMFETDKLPTGEDWLGKGFKNAADSINSQLDLLLTPSQYCVDLFRKEGVTIPIEILHNAVNTSTYHYVHRNKREDFTFVMTGTLTLRKNPGAVISAFVQLFRDNPDVHLVLKTQSGTLGHLEFKNSGDIRIIDRPYTEVQMMKLLQAADAFVFPSRGEGFGMPPIEALATGLPTIIADNTGMREYADLFGVYVVKHGETKPAMLYPNKWGDVGNWFDPDFEDLKAKMLEVYNNRKKVTSSVSGLISAGVLERFNYDVVAQQFVDAISKHYHEW